MDLKRSISIEVKGNMYDLRYPTVYQVMQIEAMKSRLTNGEYGNMVTQGTFNALTALDFVDMVAYLTVLCPELLGDLKAKSIVDMDAMDAKELMDVYKRDVTGWIREWQRILSGVNEKEVQEVNDKIREQDKEAEEGLAEDVAEQMRRKK